jgi:hypothetical protein
MDSWRGALEAQQAAYWVSGAENAGADFFYARAIKKRYFRIGSRRRTR